MARIRTIHAREILDSRGRPTVEVELCCDDRSRGLAMVPSGASCGPTEAVELRDGDPRWYDGLGVRRAVEHVRQQIAPALIGWDPTDQQAIDGRLCELDGTPGKARLGANALLGVSLAAAHAAAASLDVPLYRHITGLLKAVGKPQGKGGAQHPPPRIPLPMTNMISGGLHAGGNLDFQDFLIVPSGKCDFPAQLEQIVRVHRSLGRLLVQEGYPSAHLVADEGGYGPKLSGPRRAVELLLAAIGAAGLEAGHDMTVAIDVAATHLFDGTSYHLTASGKKESLSTERFIDQLAALADAFPISSIEDGLASDDWQGWQALMRRLGGRVQILGDDLLTTNLQRLERAIELGAANAVLVKVNQIGTLSETLAVIDRARRAGFRIVVSARSGETEDTTLADLAVAAAADGIKIGSVTRGERLAKYNRLLRIAEEL